jgi:hypothetical protein
MIGKDDKINYYILKSKTAFETSFRTLSKLAKQLKIRLRHKSESIMLKRKNFITIIL